MGPKQSLLPNSTETPSPTRACETLPRTVPRGASSQGPGHRVMGRWDLSGDNRPWGKAPGACACTGVRILQSQRRLASPEKGISGRTDWESTENMTLPEQKPFLTPFPSPSSTSGLLPQATQVFRGLPWKVKTCCLMLKVNTSLSCATTPHTGKPSPWGTDFSLWPLSQDGLRTVNSRTESNTGTFSHFPSDHTPLLVEVSCTQQQGAPQLTPWSPSGHTPGPGPSPLRAEHPLVNPDLSPQEWEDSRVLMLLKDPDCNHVGHLKHYQAVDQHKLPEGESLVRGYKTWVCKMPN